MPMLMRKDLAAPQEDGVVTRMNIADAMDVFIIQHQQVGDFFQVIHSSFHRKTTMLYMRHFLNVSFLNTLLEQIASVL